MNAPRLTDAQVSQALRAHLPERAQAGLRERILEAAETTGQQRALPSFLGALSDADPVNRRRSLLIAAALLVALALASGRRRRGVATPRAGPLERLSLEPPADIQAFVQSSDDRMPELPPVAFTTLDSDDGKGRIYVDRSGAVRIERYASGDAAEPATSMILSGNRFGRTVTVGPDTVWVEQDEAIGEDPRVYLSGLGRLGGGVDCESADNLALSTTGPRRRAGDTSASRRSPGARPTTSHVRATSGSTSRPGSSCAAGRRSLDDSGQPIPGASRSYRGDRDRVRRAAGRVVRVCTAAGRGSHVDRGVSRPVRAGPDGVPRGSSLFRHATASGSHAAAGAQPDARRASQPERLHCPVTTRPERSCRPAGVDPGEPERGLAGAGPLRARRWRERSSRCRPRTSILRATPDPLSSRASTSTT